MNVSFEKSLKFLLFSMKLVLTHPEIPINFKWLIRFSLSYGLFSTMSFLIMYNFYLNVVDNNFPLACKHGIFSLTYFGATLNNIIMFWYRDTFENLLNIMQNDHEMASKLSEDEQKIFFYYAKKKASICKFWLMLLSLTSVVFNGRAIILMLYYASIGEPKLVHLYDMVYPDFIEKRKGELGMYLVTYVLIFVLGIYEIFLFLSFAPFGPVLMLHACGHLEICKKKTETLFSGDTSEVNEKLNEIVKMLQYTYNFVENAKKCFTLYYDAMLKLSAVVLPITFYALLESLKQGELTVEVSSFIISGIAISSVPCYCSDLLLEKGEEVRLAIYACGWEVEYNRRARSTILFLVTRCSRPVAMSTIFKTLCLDALTDMFQQAYTIFNLMNAALK